MVAAQRGSSLSNATAPVRRQLTLADWWEAQTPAEQQALVIGAGIDCDVADARLHVPTAESDGTEHPVHDTSVDTPVPTIRNLESILRARLRSTVRLSFHENRRTMVSVRSNRNQHHVRLHRMFEAAPGDVVDALTRYIVLRDRSANRVIQKFVESSSNARDFRPLSRGTARGSTFDLQELLEEVWTQFGPDQSDPNVQIQWGDLGRTQRRQRSIRLGSYSVIDKSIRIHPALDSAFVPRFFVAFVVYHELLHHWLPGIETEGRLHMHHAEFRRREANHPRFQDALQWEKENIDKLLRHTAKLRRTAKEVRELM